MKRISLVLFFFIFFQNLLQTQPLRYYTSEKNLFSVTYKNNEDSTHAEGNNILRELAKQVLRDPWKVDVLIHYTLRTKIVHDQGNTFCLLYFGDVRVTGDVMYRQFNISDVLVPSRLNLHLRLTNRADTSRYTETILNNIQVLYTDSLLCKIRVENFNPEIDTLFLRQVELYYDHEGFQHFMSRLLEIHDYYASCALLDDLDRMIDTMDLPNTSRLPVHYIQIEEINKVIERIKSRNFFETLLKSGFDPKSLGPRLNGIYKTSRSLTFTYRDVLLSTGAIPWDGNTDSLADYFSGRIYTYVRRSQLMDDAQGMIFQDFLNHYFDQSTFPSEDKIFEALLSRMFPDAKSDTIVAYAARKIDASYRRMAKSLIHNFQYADAFSLMEHASRMKGLIHYEEPSSQKNYIQMEAANGIFNAYTGIAAACIKNRQFTMAGDYLTKAMIYQKEHPGYIVADSLFRKVYNDLFFIRNADGGQLLTQQRQEEAIQCDQSLGQQYSDQDLQFSMTRFHEKILPQKCHNLQDSVYFLSIRAGCSITLKNFLRASDYLTQAINLATTHPDCEISVDALKDTLVYYHDAVIYQQNLLDAQSFTVTGAYYQAVSLLNEDEKIYQDHRLDRLGFSMESVFDFVAQRFNPSLTEQAIAFYQNIGNWAESLRFLRLIRNQGYPAKSSIIVQQQLGKLFAQQNFLNNPHANPQIVVVQYAGEDEWFKVLRNSFLEEWARLVN
ncbi:MAG: hypothetical protein PHF97_10430 [Bacteroidales bacterium]|nr:hypothetical protein [Bacteroidales bacterium]